MPQLHRWQRLALAVLTAGLAALPPAARAEDWENKSFWYGFLLGSGTTACELLDAGLLSRNDARDWLDTLLQADPNIPAVSLREARSSLAENETKCPVPARP